MHKYLLLIILALFLPACASSPANVRYYHLPAPPGAAQGLLAGDKYIFVAPVRVAEYLAGSGIVYQLDAVEYKSAQNNRWAEALSSQLQSSLAAELRSRLPEQMLLTRRGEGPQLSLSVQLNGFHGRYDGKAVVSGEWVISGGGKDLLQKTFAHEVQQQADGYKALVEALYAGWSMEAERLAEVLKSLPGAR